MERIFIKIRVLRMLPFLVAGLFMAMSAGSVEASGLRLKAKLGAVPFVANNIEAMAFTEYLTTVLLNELDNTGSFEIAERKRLESMMALEGVRSDSMTPVQMQKLGNRLGLDFLVSGNVTSQPQGMQIDVKLLSVVAQKSVFSEQLRVTQSEASRLLRELAGRIRSASQGTTAPVAAVAAGPLPVPEGLEATGSTNAIRLRWSCQHPERVVGYLVMRAVAAEGPFNTVSTVTETAYVDENLRLNESYHYRIVAVGQGGGSSQPTQAVRGATTIAPAVPIFMNVEPLLGGARLSWRQRPFAGGDERTAPKGVRIYRKASTGKEFLPVAKAGDEPPTYLDSGLKDGTTYLYAMTAFNQAGAESELSVQLSVTTPPATAALTAASGKVRRVPISWQMHTSELVSAYKLQRASAKEGPFQEIAFLNGRDKVSYLDADLPDNTTYWYRVLAVSRESGTGGPSAEVSATTRDLPPAPVKVIAASGEPRRVSLKWETIATADDEVVGYHVYRGEQGQESLLKIAELKVQQTWFRDDEKPLKDNTGYSYVVSAVNAGGAVSKLSDRANAVTKAVPSTPGGLSAASGEARKVTLRWSKNPESDITEYVIYRKLDDGDYRQFIKTGDTLFVDAELKDGQSYSYKIQAVDKDGLESQLSKIATVTTKPLPATVSGVTIKDRAARILSWEKSSQADVKRYHLYKKSFFGGQKLATVETTDWKATEPGKLELYVTAEDADGLESEPSAIVILE